MKSIFTCSFASLAIVITTASCNVFSPFSSPGGDVQLISAARARLDQGDYAGALDAYQKLSGDSADIAASEEAYTILVQNGAGFGAFATSFGSSPNAKGINQLSSLLVSGSGQTKRLAIYSAYQKTAAIQTPQLKSLVRFLTAGALAAEILSEASAITGGQLTSNSLALRGTACGATANTTNVLEGCALSTACDAPVGSVLSVAATDGDITQAAPSGTTPSLDQLFSALNEAVNGLSVINATDSTLNSFQNLFNTGQAGSPSAGEPQARCFRATLINQGIAG
ncbi:hypothetical protein WDW37_17105 [Bdellovibrionota bacterium FG-1]